MNYVFIHDNWFIILASQGLKPVPKEIFQEPKPLFQEPRIKFAIINSGVGVGVGCEVNYGNLAEGSGSGKAILYETLMV